MDTMEYYGWKMVIEKRSYSPFEHCYPIQCERLRRLQKRSLIKEHDGSDLLSVVSKDHFAFSALPKDMAPHRKSIIDDRRHVLFVRDDYIMPIYLAYALRKGMPELLEKLNQAIALMFNRLSGECLHEETF
ncbi:hypothetical protein NECAME_16888 [Necator americanus]|uniref:Uncharacterized protein n=1 Tax=Necator americanus TaxID=51031 RepID=W2TVT3_NECAM|nr:hypothetical protein NECAME_16888 [Necator americanus]ETN85171.1 hypothetical protein NECAME_16888 [Necator americanus]